MITASNAAFQAGHAGSFPSLLHSLLQLGRRLVRFMRRPRGGGEQGGTEYLAARPSTRPGSTSRREELTTSAEVLGGAAGSQSRGLWDRHGRAVGNPITACLGRSHCRVLGSPHKTSPTDPTGMGYRSRVVFSVTDYTPCARHPSPRRSRPHHDTGCRYAGTGTPT
jgi:hypothetical protein